MIIKVDQEGEQVFNQLLDTFLKINGLNALDSINKIKNSIEKIEETLNPKQ